MDVRVQNKMLFPKRETASHSTLLSQLFNSRQTQRFHSFVCNMRPPTFLLVLLAAVAAASPHGQPHHYPHGSICTTTVGKGGTKTVTRAGTTTKISTISTGTATATATVTTTTTTQVDNISSCAAPTTTALSKRDYKPTAHGCWTTATVTAHRRTTTISHLSTVTSLTTVSPNGNLAHKTIQG